MLDVLTFGAARKYTDSTATELRSEIQDMSALKFKGIKPTVNDLPLAGLTGDFWLVQEDNNEYFWTGSAWEAFGGVISSNGFTPTQFVDSLPQSNIDTNSNYAVLASKLFPDATNLVTSSLSKAYVTYTEANGFRLMTCSSFNLYDQLDGNPLKTTYKIYQVVDDEWSLLIDEQSDKIWASTMGIPKYSANNPAWSDPIIFGSTDIKTNYNQKIIWVAADKNIANITGTVIKAEGRNNYLWDFYKYEDNDWTYLGRNNFYSLFDKNLEAINTALASKADAATTYTKTEVDTAVGTKLNSNQGSANVGKVMIVGNDGGLTPEELSGEFTSIDFVDSLPESDISTNKYYSTIARDNLYPDASNLIAGDLPRIMISLVDGEYRAVTTNRSDYDGFFDYNYGRPSSIAYQKHYIVNEEWTTEATETNNGWASFLGITDRNNLGDLKYCNHRLCSEINTNPVWNPTGTEGNNINTVKITGEPISSAGYNINIWAVYKRENNDWTKLGNFNFTSVFENIVGVKLDKNQGSTNAGKFMKVGSDGNLVPDAITIPTYSAGQNIFISAQNEISAGIEVIEV